MISNMEDSTLVELLRKISSQIAVINNELLNIKAEINVLKQEVSDIRDILINYMDYSEGRFNSLEKRVTVLEGECK